MQQVGRATGQVGAAMTITTLGILLSVTPTLVKNAFRHYFRFWVTLGAGTPRERAHEFLYDQLFHMVKKLTVYLTHHTVEDAQKLTDQTVPSPPWAFNEQVMIPHARCDESALLLQTYFGPEQMHSFIGGPRWWQMRTQDGVPAEWISLYADYHSTMLKRGERGALSTSMMKHFMRGSTRANPRHEQDSSGEAGPRQAGRYADTAEERNRLQRILFYIHGGAYYFGSVNTHKYMILRIASKFGGFAFAPNYRKAPQFPFPCAIQDCLAAYLYLLDPPADAPHPPIKPEQIVVAGDSAGGGLALALLQLIRDLGLPAPAGGVLLSPWSDLTHSFPSILQNTATDYIPPYSFVHKPSTLWPLPTEIGAYARRKWLPFRQRRSRMQQAEAAIPDHQQPLYVPSKAGKMVALTSQIQFYATNAQLLHPLCSPALAGSLGGLPPLYILCGDDEVLRDEILYVAHKAAHPAEYPLGEELLDRFPNTRATYERYRNVPTPVHLQLYDGQCHVFPMFLYTPPAKAAFRAMASFIKLVTGAPMGKPTGLGAAATGENQYSGKVPLERPAFHNNMIRERIAVDGKVRPMEPAAAISALNLPRETIGVVRPEAWKRFVKGHTIWDTKYRHTAKRVTKRRARCERRARRILAKAETEGLLTSHGGDILAHGPRWKNLGSYGPADLTGEAPPPSAIVGRRDTVRRDILALTQPDAVEMLKYGLQLRAKQRRERGDEPVAPPAARRSFADEMPHHTGIVGEHFHDANERPIDVGRNFGFWKRAWSPAAQLTTGLLVRAGAKKEP